MPWIMSATMGRKSILARRSPSGGSRRDKVRQAGAAAGRTDYSGPFSHPSDAQPNTPSLPNDRPHPTQLAVRMRGARRDHSMEQAKPRDMNKLRDCVLSAPALDRA